MRQLFRHSCPGTKLIIYSHVCTLIMEQPFFKMTFDFTDGKSNILFPELKGGVSF